MWLSACRCGCGCWDSMQQKRRLKENYEIFCILRCPHTKIESSNNFPSRPFRSFLPFLFMSFFILTFSTVWSSFPQTIVVVTQWESRPYVLWATAGPELCCVPFFRRKTAYPKKDSIFLLLFNWALKSTPAALLNPTCGSGLNVAVQNGLALFSIDDRL